MKTHALSSLLLATLITAALPAQDGRAKKPAFKLDAGAVEIEDLINRCAIYLQWNILWDEQELQAASVKPIRLQMPISTDDHGCQEFLANMLYRSGFALTALDASKDIYEVVFMQGQRGREVMNRAQQATVNQVLARPQLKMVVTTVIPLRHINAQIASNALRPFFMSHGGMPGSSLTIGNVGASTSLLCAGFQDQVAQAIRLVQACDVEQPPQPYSGKQQLPEYVAALEKRLRELEKQLEKVRGKAK